MPRRSDMIRSVFRVACVVRRRGCRPSGNRRRRVPCQLHIRSRKHRLSQSIHYLEETVFRSEPHPSFPDPADLYPGEGVGARRSRQHGVSSGAGGRHGQARSTHGRTTTSSCWCFGVRERDDVDRFVAEFIDGVLVRRGKRRPKRAVSLLTTFSKEER